MSKETYYSVKRRRTKPRVHPARKRRHLLLQHAQVVERHRVGPVGGRCREPQRSPASGIWRRGDYSFASSSDSEGQCSRVLRAQVNSMSAMAGGYGSRSCRFALLALLSLPALFGYSVAAPRRVSSGRVGGGGGCRLAHLLFAPLQSPVCAPLQSPTTTTYYYAKLNYQY